MLACFGLGVVICVVLPEVILVCRHMSERTCINKTVSKYIQSVHSLHLHISAAWKERSAHMVKLCGDVSSKRAATSRANSSAISTLSFVGVSSSSTMISRAKASCATCWLHR